MACAATQNGMTQTCHCDERSEEAIPNCDRGDRFAAARGDGTGVISSEGVSAEAKHRHARHEYSRWSTHGGNPYLITRNHLLKSGGDCFVADAPRNDRHQDHSDGIPVVRRFCATTRPGHVDIRPGASSPTLLLMTGVKITPMEFQWSGRLAQPLAQGALVFGRALGE